jgi:hypothetical protein
MARRKRKDENKTAIEIVLWALIGVPAMGVLFLAEIFRGMSRKAKRDAARRASTAPHKHKYGDKTSRVRSSRTKGESRATHVRSSRAKGESRATRIQSYDDAREEMVRGLLIPTLRLILEEKVSE